MLIELLVGLSEVLLGIRVPVGLRLTQILLLLLVRILSLLPSLDPATVLRGLTHLLLLDRLELLLSLGCLQVCLVWILCWVLILVCGSEVGMLLCLELLGCLI